MAAGEGTEMLCRLMSMTDASLGGLGIWTLRCPLDFGPRLLNRGRVKTRSLFSFPSLTRSGCQSTRVTWRAPAPLVPSSFCCPSLAWSGAGSHQGRVPCASPWGPVPHKWWPVRCCGFLPRRSWTVPLHLL